jgi:hypothetical protein
MPRFRVKKACKACAEISNAANRIFALDNFNFQPAARGWDGQQVNCFDVQDIQAKPQMEAILAADPSISLF